MRMMIFVVVAFFKELDKGGGQIKYKNRLIKLTLAKQFNL